MNALKFVNLGDLHILPGEFDYADLEEQVGAREDWFIVDDVVVRQASPIHGNRDNKGSIPINEDDEICMPSLAKKNETIDPGKVEFIKMARDLLEQENVKSWGLDRMDQRFLPLSKTFTFHETGGQGVDVYVIDTGINIHHVDFEGRATWGITTAKNSLNNVDKVGHGTFVAGIIGGKVFGVAKKVNLIAVKVLNDYGEGSLSGILYGIEYVVRQHSKTKRPSIANLSLGTGRNRLVDLAVNQMTRLGIVVVVAAGNGNEFGQPDNACSTSPAGSDQAITVGAIDVNDSLASWSNIGPCVSLFAPGEYVMSDFSCPTNSSIGVESGTSFSSPYVAGIAALMMGEFTEVHLTPKDVADKLLLISTKNVVSGLEGTGSPNILAYSQTQELKNVIGTARVRLQGCILCDWHCKKEEMVGGQQLEQLILHTE
ncbi:hypothetical protein G9A89_023268 [Geosiphon pyriformis]|nr:hypothetical protein G9A89_023268 [Geosiphon pyriformis]